MEECEALIRSVASQIEMGERCLFQGKRIDLSFPWERATVEEVFKRFTRISMEEALEEKRFDEVMVQEIEPFLGVKKPTFLYDFPQNGGACPREERRPDPCRTV